MTDTPASGHLHNPVRKIRQYLHPSGRTVHIVNSPDAAETLRKELSKVQTGEQFDLYIQGTEEHVKAINEIRAHSEQRRLELQKTHADVFAEVEAVHNELDSLAAELAALTTQDVSLDANFGRFGYSAHIRTKEVDSGANSIYSTKTLSDEDRRMGSSLKFWKPPVVRQYFHKGLLWRSSESTEVAAFELFVDLLYVGIISIIGDQASEEATGASLLQFSITFILSWKLWSELTMIVAWFECDTIFQRLCVLLFMACLIGYTVNIQDSLGSTYTQMIAFYLSQRVFEALYFLMLAYLLPMIRGMMVGLAVMIFVTNGLWIASIHVEEPNRLAIIWIAIVMELFGNGFIVPLIRRSDTLQEKAWFRPIAKWMQFHPALNIEHKTERTNAFVGLVLGYAVVSLLYQSSAESGIDGFYGKAILGLVMAFAFNTIYFEIDGANIYRHAIRRGAIPYFIWNYFHLPFIMSFILVSGALAKLVLTHDSPNTPIEALTEMSAAKSDETFNAGLRWFYCAGLGIALASTGAISLSHLHKDLPTIRLKKSQRIALRFGVSITLVCLSLAESLNSLQLVATTTGLIVFVVLIELWGCTCSREGFWFDRSRQCKYSAECRLARKDLEAVKMGEIENVNELAKRDKGEKDLFET